MAGDRRPGDGYDPWQDVPRRRGRPPARPGASSGAGADASPEQDPWKDVPRRLTVGDRVMERLERRRARIASELSGEYRGRLPTWALAAILVAFVTAWVLLVVLAS